MIKGINSFLEQADRILWGPWLIFLLLGTGCYLMLRLRFLPIRNLGRALGLLVHPESRQRGECGGVSAFSSLTTELAATIGTGNIVGVATAITAGGAGALFWMLLSGVIGMATKLAESTLCVRYRIRNGRGEPVGGPMYVLRDAFPCKAAGRVLSYLFALFAVFASFGMGNMTQSNSIAEALHITFQIPVGWTGIVLGILTILVVCGGIGMIAKVTEYLVPCMAVFYLFGTGMILFTHRAYLLSGLLHILQDAFQVRAAAGGMAGAALRYGISRGVFSNEAGLGAAGISAASAETDDPVRQGYISMTGVFIDTIVICTLTGLAITVSGVLESGQIPDGEAGGTALMTAVFASTFGPTGAVLLAISIVLFAFATIIAWAYQGEKAWEYLTGSCRYTIWYRGIYGVVAFVGAVCSLEAVWSFSDICNGLMAVPNLIAVLVLSGETCRLIKNH